MEQSKFTPALANLKKPQVQETVAAEPSVVVEPIQRGRGRPRSKSSDPEYQSTTLILRKTTKRKASHLLEDREMGKDLSELVEELLTEWLEKQV